MAFHMFTRKIYKPTDLLKTHPPLPVSLCSGASRLLGSAICDTLNLLTLWFSKKDSNVPLKLRLLNLSFLSFHTPIYPHVCVLNETENNRIYSGFHDITHPPYIIVWCPVSAAC